MLMSPISKPMVLIFFIVVEARWSDVSALDFLSEGRWFEPGSNHHQSISTE